MGVNWTRSCDLGDIWPLIQKAFSALKNSLHSPGYRTISETLTPNLLSDPRSLSEGRPNVLKVTRSSPAASTDPFYLLTRDKMNGSCVEDLRLGPGGSLHPLFVQKNLWEEAEPLCGVHNGQQKKPKSSVTVTWV